MKRMPIWVQLRKIPLQYFHPKGISYIASAIGKPLYMDRATAIRSRLDYAKVCVEVEVENEIPQFLSVDLGNGYIVEVLVDIPWMPDKCDRCKVFGHRCNNTIEVALAAAPAAHLAEVHRKEVEDKPKCVAPNPITEEESRAAAATPATAAHTVSFSGTMVKSRDGLSADSIRNRKKALFTEEVVADLEEEEDNHGSVAQAVLKLQGMRKSRSGKGSKAPKALARNISHSWVLIGDFNAIKDIQEVKAVGREVVIDQSMRDFADFLNSTELTDHTSIGCYYMWSNKRQEGFQARKIDRVLINEKWVLSE
ncbi:hypothetical protein CRG98_040456 [Punica granatum]|uniref:Uncharacterized protein n=1 Tax=Punica granatum TaxID=22663 RepID=A0A2I0I566_PUNGR|nr:hypothetical protein CRG98_040456 [Punica granatum]